MHLVILFPFSLAFLFVLNKLGFIKRLRGVLFYIHLFSPLAVVLLVPSALAARLRCGASPRYSSCNYPSSGRSFVSVRQVSHPPSSGRSLSSVRQVSLSRSVPGVS